MYTCLLIASHCIRKAKWMDTQKMRARANPCLAFSILSRQDAASLTCPWSSEFIQVNAKSLFQAGVSYISNTAERSVFQAVAC